VLEGNVPTPGNPTCVSTLTRPLSQWPSSVGQSGAMSCRRRCGGVSGCGTCELLTYNSALYVCWISTLTDAVCGRTQRSLRNPLMCHLELSFHLLVNRQHMFSRRVTKSTVCDELSIGTLPPSVSHIKRRKGECRL